MRKTAARKQDLRPKYNVTAHVKAKSGKSRPNNGTPHARQVQGLLGQCIAANMANLGILAMLNLQVTHFIIDETVRIPPLRFSLKQLQWQADQMLTNASRLCCQRRACRQESNAHIASQ
jgi:hypothetical protein